ncbi:MFS transporter [Rhodobacteraceae bacterium RKSG542]|uniref:MFS transporter n=1 Tax=Pseudovibrio flavus TaxID=2529854 RepID=UPI0012BC17EE|nr:MFS transporter [Pseudovibrio flavus]MTI16223.1 MFS transporter [Pseudovibrio flavus]
MLEPLKNKSFRYLFAAQVTALFGTGLATVALGLLAFDLAGEDAGVVLGTAFTIKMIAYVGLAPIAAAIAERLPRRAFLVLLDLVRAGVAVLLPFVDQIWQIYLLIFVLQSASAAFTPAFQSTIPVVLADKQTYTKALSLSRIAYDLENLLSPTIAGLLLLAVSYHGLFWGTALGFLASTMLILSVSLPAFKPVENQRSLKRITQGLRIFRHTPRLRGLFALYLCIAAGGSMVIINTVVIVQGQMGLSAGYLAGALAAFGGGSMVAALALPQVLEKLSERLVMTTGGAVIVVGLLLGNFVSGYNTLLALWFVMGLGYSGAQTPTGRILTRSANEEDLPAVFAAQFALSHACWLLAYPLAGGLGARFGMTTAFSVLALIGLLGILLCLRLWPADDQEELTHDHPELAKDDPHMNEGRNVKGHRHTHVFHIDDHHPHWPNKF